MGHPLGTWRKMLRNVPTQTRTCLLDPGPHWHELVLRILDGLTTDSHHQEEVVPHQDHSRFLAFRSSTPAGRQTGQCLMVQFLWRTGKQTNGQTETDKQTRRAERLMWTYQTICSGLLVFLVSTRLKLSYKPKICCQTLTQTSPHRKLTANMCITCRWEGPVHKCPLSVKTDRYL